MIRSALAMPSEPPPSLAPPPPFASPPLPPPRRYLSSNESAASVSRTGCSTSDARRPGAAAPEDGDVHLHVVVERGLDERREVELEGQLERLLELLGGS